MANLSVFSFQCVVVLSAYNNSIITKSKVTILICLWNIAAFKIFQCKSLFFYSCALRMFYKNINFPFPFKRHLSVTCFSLFNSQASNNPIHFLRAKSSSALHLSPFQKLYSLRYTSHLVRKKTLQRLFHSDFRSILQDFT